MGRAVHHRNAIADGRSSCHIVGARVCVASGATADQLAGSVAEVIATYIRMCVGVGDSVAASNASPAGRSKTGDSSCGGCASADIRLARGHRPPGTGCTGAGSKAACVSAGRRTIEAHSAAGAGACNRGIGSRGCIGPVLVAADATPAKAATAMTIKDFFMIIPLNSEFSDHRDEFRRKIICHCTVINANRSCVLASQVSGLFQNVHSVNGSFNKPDENRNTLFGHEIGFCLSAAAICAIY